MKKRFFLLILLIMPCMLLFSACEKNMREDVNNDSKSSVKVEVYIDNVLVDSITTDFSKNYFIAPPNPENYITNSTQDSIFSGWFLDSDFQELLTDDTKFTVDCKIYGKWLKVFYNNFTYSISNGKATITSFNNSNGLTMVAVPSCINSFPVEVIGKLSFSNQSLIENVVICEGIKNIEAGAFSGCYSLKTINSPNTLMEIGNSAFSGCHSIKSITLPNSVKFIGKSAFNACANLTKIVLPFIGNGSDKTHFGYVFGAESIVENRDYIPSSLKEVIIKGGKRIENEAFRDCVNLINVMLPETITTIGEGAFFKCSNLINMKIPKSVDKIERSAFMDCSGLTSIVLEDGITTLGDSVFYGCSELINIEIPNSLEMVGSGVFVGCNNLIYNIYDNAQYLGNKENKYIILMGAINREIVSCEINQNCKFIDAYAFSNCTTLKQINITEGIVKFDRQAFAGCSSLTTVIIPNSVINMEHSIFDRCTVLTIYCKATSKPNGWNARWNEDHCPVYWYSENQPVTSGNFWHYGPQGNIVEW